MTEVAQVEQTLQDLKRGVVLHLPLQIPEIHPNQMQSLLIKMLLFTSVIKKETHHQIDNIAGLSSSQSL